jgi:catechol 2,3-dioxygenase-like lactoylglutathione lyase family enzyme
VASVPASRAPGTAGKQRPGRHHPGAGSFHRAAAAVPVGDPAPEDLGPENLAGADSIGVESPGEDEPVAEVADPSLDRQAVPEPVRYDGGVHRVPETGRPHRLTGCREVRCPAATGCQDGGMNWTLEVVVIPVSDIDRAKAFYADGLGFHLDHDLVISDDVRIVQLTPPGSGCSIVIGKGAVPDMPPGSLKGLQLVVSDIKAAYAELVARGIEVSEIQKLGENPSPVPDPLDNVGFIFFADPDGNSWAVQQISDRG